MSEQTEAAEQPRAPEVDEVLRRIGRNLLLFQHIEHLLKYLMSNARIEGSASSVQTLHAQRRARIHTQTMGQLAGRFVDDVLADAGDRDAQAALTEDWVSFGFTIQSDSTYVAQHSAEMKAVVDARNDLIHHFLPRWSPVSAESTREALAYLDTQRALALLMRDRLQSFAKTVDAAAKANVAIMATPEGEREFELLWLRHSRLVLLLGELATKTPRADRWMDLATAGQVVRQLEPAELDGMAERYGHRTLKRLLLATELFDVQDEPMPRGGTRTIYRISPRYELHIQTEPTSSNEGAGSAAQPTR